ncbi:MAG TPA: hypothetical protein VE570_01070, partial [Thermoleophilaceae bacterium]|nr:hypothetical protein [Thermoleophilaceae bacterium]
MTATSFASAATARMVRIAVRPYALLLSQTAALERHVAQRVAPAASTQALALLDRALQART